MTVGKAVPRNAEGQRLLSAVLTRLSVQAALFQWGEALGGCWLREDAAVLAATVVAWRDGLEQGVSEFADLANQQQFTGGASSSVREGHLATLVAVAQVGPLRREDETALGPLAVSFATDRRPSVACLGRSALRFSLLHDLLSRHPRPVPPVSSYVEAAAALPSGERERGWLPRLHSRNPESFRASVYRTSSTRLPSLCRPLC